MRTSVRDLLAMKRRGERIAGSDAVDERSRANDVAGASVGLRRRREVSTGIGDTPAEIVCVVAGSRSRE